MWADKCVNTVECQDAVWVSGSSNRKDLFSGEIIKSFAGKLGHTHKKVHVMKAFEINASKTWYTFKKKKPRGKHEFKKETCILRLQQFNQEISLLSNKVRTEIETDMCKKKYEIL